MAISVPLELPEETLKQLQQLMLISAQDAFKQASQQETYGEWLTKTKACKYLDVSFNTLQTFINLGLKVSIINGNQRISRTELDRFMASYQI